MAREAVPLMVFVEVLLMVQENVEVELELGPPVAVAKPDMEAVMPGEEVVEALAVDVFEAVPVVLAEDVEVGLVLIPALTVAGPEGGATPVGLAEPVGAPVAALEALAALVAVFNTETLCVVVGEGLPECVTLDAALRL